MAEQQADTVAALDTESRPIAIPQTEDNTSAEPAVTGESKGTSKSDPAIPASLQTWTDKALDFLAHASNETLGACLAGLGATTYLVLGRVGLVIIGVAGGVVLHATWDGVRGDTRDEETKRRDLERKREAGIEVVRRVLERRGAGSAEEPAPDTKVLASHSLDYSRFGPDTEKALNYFTESVIKDYVYYWYGPTLPGEEAFPASCRRTFTAFMLSLSGHLERKRPADAFLDFVTNASSIIIVFLNELSAALNASPNSAPGEAISTYLQLKPDCSLSYILDEKAQDTKLADVAEEILQAYLDPKAYNCPPVYVFLKQILAQLVLGSTLTLCSRPEWINEWIVYGLEESETTKNVMDIVDAGVEGRSAPDVPKTSTEAEGSSPQRQDIISRKESAARAQEPTHEHRRQPSKAEEAMDDAMREAKRLTQLMMEEDERKAREERESQAALSSSEDISELNTQGAPTPTSSQSDRERQEEESSAWGTEASSMAETAASSSGSPETPSSKQQFTNFDQLGYASQPTALSDSPDKPKREASQLTLHNANISIFDDSQPGEKASIKAKPQTDYLIQIEPSSSAFPGWMIARKYADFEMLHEVLRRISVITGVYGFTEAHAELPKWREHTKSSLRTGLERYITDAVRFQPLAESEGMKRFLEKDQGLNKSPSANKAFGWPTPDAFGKFGGDMMNVLTKAPKTVAGGVTGGGKAVFGGVAGLVGGVSGKRPSPSPTNLSRATSSSVDSHKPRPSVATLDSYNGSLASARMSQESLRAPARPSFDRRMSAETSGSGESKPQEVRSPQRVSFEKSRSQTQRPVSSASSLRSDTASTQPKEQEQIKLPPLPSEMPEDYTSPTKSARTSIDALPSAGVDSCISQTLERESASQPPRPSRPTAKPKEPISEAETSVAVELMFAVITELYTLSSAWNIRRTLLTAAKSFLLRPGNPQLASIRDLLQESMLDSNLSDSGIAGHIYKLRENALPTEEEMEIWRRDYPEKTEEQKEELRVKARKLLVTKGMPQALSSVMGAAASGEALGKVFDCLQQPEVSRGLIFGLMRQALRVITH